jgi:O-antigen ligase
VLGNVVTISSLALAMVGAPFLFGSTDTIAIAFWCCVLGAGLLFSKVRGLRSIHFVVLGFAAILAAAYAFVLHEQLVFTPWIAGPHPIWEEASKALGDPMKPSAAIEWNQPFFAMGNPLLSLLALVSGFVVGTDRIASWRLLRIVAWSGAAYAAYALVAFLVAPTKVLWRTKLAHEYVLTGTFLNRNTAAVFFGACSVLWVLLLLEKLRKLVPPKQFGFVDAIRRALNERARPFAVPSLMLLLCLAAMFLTASRAGVVLSLGAILLAAFFSGRRLLSRRTSVLLVGLALASCLVVLVQILAPGLGARFDVEGVTDAGRLGTYRSTLAMIADRLWLGNGLGTFEAAFPAYRSSEISMWGTWNRAHNTILEIATDLGLPIAALVVAGWTLFVAILLRGSLVRQRDVAIPAAGLSIGLLGLVHSLVDFPLQIPGFAVVCFGIVGLGLAQSLPKPRAAALPGSLEDEGGSS